MTKKLVILTVLFWIIVLIALIAKIKYYSWALWLVPLFFAGLTYLIVRFLEPRIKDRFFATNFSQSSMFKLIMLIAFILLFRLFLDKTAWIGFVGYSIINYIVFTAVEIQHLLKLLRQ